MHSYISIIIPTYNAERYLDRCLRKIFLQDYPKSLYEVIIVDGGSTDKTLSIAKKYKTKILKNPNRDAESGKAIGIEKSKGEIIALIDADNEIVQDNWISEMIKPLIENKEIFGVESPWLVRKKDSLLNQYFAMLRIADPLARRFHPSMQVVDKGDYVIYKMKLGSTPVVGANGFLYRKKFIKKIGFGSKFEEVNFVAKLVSRGYISYAVPKNVGIYHHYVSSVGGYVRKRVKIGKKFMSRKANGQKTWVDSSSSQNFLLAVLYNVSIIGPTIEAIREIYKTRKIAWIYHPFISFLTIVVYSYIFLQFKLLNKNKNQGKEP